MKLPKPQKRGDNYHIEIIVNGSSPLLKPLEINIFKGFYFAEKLYRDLILLVKRWTYL